MNNFHGVFESESRQKSDSEQLNLHLQVSLVCYRNSHGSEKQDTKGFTDDKADQLEASSCNMTDMKPQPHRPLGPAITSTAPFAPAAVGLHGRTCELEPLNSTHFEHLYQALNHPELWDYMLSGPFPDFDAFSRRYTKIVNNKGSTLYFAILPQRSMTPEGLIALMDINTQHHSLEIGHVILGTSLQKKTAATEAVYLALNYAFMLGFTRVVWKCNNLNAASKNAAERLGFEFEGVLKRHMVVKGRVRDTALFAITLDEWQGVKVALEEWLRESNFDEKGRQRKTLKDVREEIQGNSEKEDSTLNDKARKDREDDMIE